MKDIGETNNTSSLYEGVCGQQKFAGERVDNKWYDDTRG